jgi:outer membrane protein OmpA-like peptidoglycan-associated protein
MNRPAARVVAPIAIAVGTLLAGSTLLARADEPGHDHAAVSRYPGAVIKDYDYKEYEEAQLILSKPVAVDGHYRADKLLPVEGHVTYLHYEIPGSASTLQVLRNYQSALKRSGFQQLYVCERPCIDGNLSDLGPLLKARDLYLNFHDQNAYLAEQRGNTYVSLALAGDGTGENARTHAFLFVVDKAGLDDGKMAVSGDSPIAQSLARDGRVDVYGFQFDTNKAVLKPGSDATLAELATVLKDNPALQIDVVGHTDDVGGDAANQRLSQARAEAVALALTQRYGIAASRIAASGRGATQPVADNGSEAGRARNRRVEIVARGVTARAGVAAQQPTAMAPHIAPAQVDAAAPAPEANGPRETLQKANDVAQTVQTATDTLSRLKGLFGH